VCLVPQLANARRVDMDLSPYPTLLRIDDECRKLPAFASAAPHLQPDFER
jgi:maleylpyruvate isomerase